MDPDPDPDADPDPTLFVSCLQDANEKYFFLTKFLCLFFFEFTLHHSLKMKSHKEVTKEQKSRFFFIFLLVLIEGSESIQINADPGSPKAYGSGTLDKNKHKQAGTLYTESTCRPVA